MLAHGLASVLIRLSFARTDVHTHDPHFPVQDPLALVRSRKNDYCRALCIESSPNIGPGINRVSDDDYGCIRLARRSSGAALQK